MAAMALALNVRLGKPGVYTLNPAGHAPLAAQLPLAIACASNMLVALISIVLLATLLIVFFKEAGR
jgi:adenosylcobinamide-phosphate synthase